MQKLEAVLLDMGGVLLDMRGSNGLPTGQLDYRGRQVMSRLAGGRNRATMEDLDRVVFEPWRVDYRQRYRRGREADITPHLEALCRLRGSSSAAADLLSGWFGPYADSLEAIPGAVVAVEALRRQDLKVALISNVPLPGDLYREVLDRHGFGRLFDTYHFSYDTGHRKPSPFMLRSALAELGAEAGAAVMVGDRKSSDVAAGRAAGAGTIWIESEHADGPEPEWTIPEISHLPALVERLSG